MSGSFVCQIIKEKLKNVKIIGITGTRWVVQPQPTKDAWSDPQKSKQVIFGPWSAGTSDLKLAETVLSWYDPKATVVWTDTRGPKYEKLS